MKSRVDMWRLRLLAFLLILSGCASPYGAGGTPDLPDVQAQFLSADLMRITPSPETVSSCPRERDAILLKAAAAALENNYTHFEFVGPPQAQYKAISTVGELEPSVVVHFCKDVCPGMFSADALTHILVPEISRQSAPMDRAYRNTHGGTTNHCIAFDQRDVANFVKNP